MEHKNDLSGESGFLKVAGVLDSDGHWYVIPNDEVEEFYKLCGMCENGDDNACMSVDEKFGKYRTGGDLNLTQLYIKL